MLLYPETDALPYDRLPSDPDKLTERLTALERLSGSRTTGAVRHWWWPRSARPWTWCSSPSVFRDSHRIVRRGDTLPPSELATQWLRLGYEPSALVDAPGLFSRRGGILDVFPPGGEPLRIELWGDEVDTIRVFDPATQRSTEQLDSAAIGPAHEVLPRPLGMALSVDSLRPQFVDVFARDLRLLREGSHAFPSLEFYRGFLGAATLVDYLTEDGLLVLEEPDALAPLRRRVRGAGRTTPRGPARARRGSARPGTPIPALARGHPPRHGGLRRGALRS